MFLVILNMTWNQTGNCVKVVNSKYLEERLVLFGETIVPELREGTDVGHVPLVHAPLFSPHLLAVLSTLETECEACECEG